jgi:hypothetical protein
LFSVILKVFTTKAEHCIYCININECRKTGPRVFLLIHYCSKKFKWAHRDFQDFCFRKGTSTFLSNVACFLRDFLQKSLSNRGHLAFFAQKISLFSRPKPERLAKLPHSPIAFLEN